MLLALTASARAGQLSYGVVPQDGAVPSGGELDLMASGGVERIRLVLHWASVEQKRGRYDWSGTDAVVRETTNHGIEPFFFIYGTPAWASKLDHRKRCGARDCTTYPPGSNATRRAFAAFAKAAVERYGPGGDFWKAPGAKLRAPRVLAGLQSPRLRESPRGLVPCVPISLPGCTPPPPPPPPAPPPPPPSPVPPPDQAPCGCTTAHPLRAWQLWNEQNSPKYYAPKVNIADYALLVKGAGAAIKKADPKADVVLGGVWGPESAKSVLPIEPYLKELYRVKGIERSFDSIAIHPYGVDTAASLAQLEAARRVVISSGDRKAGIWISELGWATDGPSTNPYVKGLEGQATLLAKTLTKFEQKRARLNLRGLFWYSWRDKAGGESICDWCGYAGLRAIDGSAKPAWDEFSRLASR